MASSLPATQIFIVRDEFRGEGLHLGGGHWDFEFATFYFGGFIAFPTLVDNTTSPRGSFSYTFNGTSVRIWGHTGSVDEDKVFQVTIDKNAPYSCSTSDLNHYKQWYQSPQLSDGVHTIKVDRLDEQSLDYFIVTPGPETPLKGQALMVDDSYNGIHYSDGWRAVTNSTFADSSIWGGSNFMNTTHETSTVGETMTFAFTGTNATVFGVFLREQIGNLSITYSIDGGTNLSTSVKSIGDDTDSSDYVSQQPNYKLFSTQSLPPGDHILTMTVTECIGQTLVVDYIVYTPSFANLASMPNLTVSAPSPTTTDGTVTPVPSGSLSSARAGSVAGGVIGGVLLIAILSFLLWWLKRRRSKANEKSRSQSFARFHNSALYNGYTVEPFTFGSLHPLTSTSPAVSSKRNSAVPVGFGPASTIPPSPNSAEETSPLAELENAQLRRRVEQLTVENARLTVQAAEAGPPAYN